ncbi:MAG: hypothetical protein KGJ70_06115, partial [Gemmatimonadota bacterium]|nr:hypothetical protein [Gemmatimonadota bacterium]
LLPAPAFIVFAALGALRGPPARRALALAPGARRGLLAGVVLIGAAAAARAALMTDAMRHYEHGQWITAAREDPGSYRIQLALAEAAQERGRCDLVRVHAGAARALFPDAPIPRRLLAGCGWSAPRR